MTGREAYEEDCRRRPTYSYGDKRLPWDRLPPAVQDTWNRNPTPREWPALTPEQAAD
jgi:hypothetical protein